MGETQAARLDSVKSSVMLQVRAQVPDITRDLEPGSRPAIPPSYLDLTSEHRATLNLAAAGLKMDTVLSCVRQAPLFAGLSLGDCTYIASQARERHLPRRETLFSQGEPRRGVFVVAKGCMKVTQLGPAGSEVILWLKGSGDVVDCLGMAPGDVNGSSAQAISACHVVFWETKTFESLVEQLPVLHRNMVKILAECLGGMQDRFHELATEKVAFRVARTLVRLLGNMSRRAGDVAHISLSREELAQMTGTTLFAVSRLLSEWTQRGVIEARRETVVIRDESRLLQMPEEYAA